MSLAEVYTLHKGVEEEWSRSIRHHYRQNQR